MPDQIDLASLLLKPLLHLLPVQRCSANLTARQLCYQRKAEEMFNHTSGILRPCYEANHPYCFLSATRRSGNAYVVQVSRSAQVIQNLFRNAFGVVQMKTFLLLVVALMIGNRF